MALASGMLKVTKIPGSTEHHLLTRSTKRQVVPKPGKQLYKVNTMKMSKAFCTHPALILAGLSLHT